MPIDRLRPARSCLADSLGTQPSFAIGARAVQLLVRRLADPQAPAQTLRLSGEVTHRESCGCRGRGDGVVADAVAAQR